MSKKLLVVVDMQNDFITGALGTPEAQGIVDVAVEKIKSWDGDIIATFDTHNNDYLDTNEGKHLPVVHCVADTDGHRMNDAIAETISDKYESYIGGIHKYTFGSTALPEYIRGRGYEEIELIGLCTDICVVSNALLLKANYPELKITVDASCCAGVTPESHKAALTTMKMCQIEVIGEANA